MFTDVSFHHMRVRTLVFVMLCVMISWRTQSTKVICKYSLVPPWIPDTPALLALS